ncbi:hypothetical protein RI570_20330 [Brucella pseudogrignonensis]|uniref:hypothetical protein n=1 Tax=Brucella pseudogrignonensis TaxID=419475 RepID=UPI0028B41A06|nr:hypothetical protein [Brucella pseudogrignonensis]MDT6942407.1 hypothetical protein [Brucella pseudogrignonensis]
MYSYEDRMRAVALYIKLGKRAKDVGARIHCVFSELTETSFMSCAFDLWDRAHAIQTQRCSPSPNTVAEVQS